MAQNKTASGALEGPDEFEDESEDSSEDSFFVPSDAVKGHDCQAGDTLNFEVLGKDENGDIEVKLSGYKKGHADDFMSNMKRGMPEEDAGGSNY